MIMFRSWFQPSQLLLMNVNNRCVFPVLSKKVTEIQGLKNNLFALENQLWEVCKCKQAWQEFPEMTITKAYLGHHKIVNAILQDNGRDEFSREGGELYYGI